MRRWRAPTSIRRWSSMSSWAASARSSEQTFNLARNVVLDAGLPVEIPATTVDFQCGSSQQAVHLAAGMIASGQIDVAVAGGVESMTRVPMGSSLANGKPFTDRIMEDYNMISQGEAADEIAQQVGHHARRSGRDRLREQPQGGAGNRSRLAATRILRPRRRGRRRQADDHHARSGLSRQCLARKDGDASARVHRGRRDDGGQQQPDQRRRGGGGADDGGKSAANSA